MKGWLYRTCIHPETARKIDVREQVILNFDVFIDFVWSKKKRIEGEKRRND